MEMALLTLVQTFWDAWTSTSCRSEQWMPKISALTTLPPG